MFDVRNCEDSESSESRSGDVRQHRIANCPRVFACMEENLLSCSVFRKMVLDSLLSGKGVVKGGNDKASSVKYF